jgi:hypothetical protein
MTEHSPICTAPAEHPRPFHTEKERNLLATAESLNWKDQANSLSLSELTATSTASKSTTMTSVAGTSAAASPCLCANCSAVLPLLLSSSSSSSSRRLQEEEGDDVGEHTSPLNKLSKVSNTTSSFNDHHNIIKMIPCEVILLSSQHFLQENRHKEGTGCLHRLHSTASSSSQQSVPVLDTSQMTEDCQSSYHGGDEASLSSTSSSVVHHDRNIVNVVVSEGETHTTPSGMIFDSCSTMDNKKKDSENTFRSTFTMFRLQYLIVHTAIMLADGLQGTFVHRVYSIFIMFFTTVHSCENNVHSSLD